MKLINFLFIIFRKFHQFFRKRKILIFHIFFINNRNFINNNLTFFWIFQNPNKTNNQRINKLFKQFFSFSSIQIFMHKQIHILFLFISNSLIFIILFHPLFLQLIFNSFLLTNLIKQNTLQNTNKHSHKPIFKHRNSNFNLQIIILIKHTLINNSHIIFIKKFLNQLNKIILLIRFRQSCNPTFKKILIFYIHSVSVNHPTSRNCS